jgi:hypothetical protein
MVVMFEIDGEFEKTVASYPHLNLKFKSTFKIHQGLLNAVLIR